MKTRRALTSALVSIGALSLTAPFVPAAFGRTRSPPGSGSYAAFLEGVRAEAASHGVPGSVLDEALALSAPNAHVLELDRHQPEFTLTWAQYRARVIGPQRLAGARSSYQAELALLTDIWRRYRVDPRIVVGIWGLESNFGTKIGTFNVVDSLATLAYDGRRASFFRSELMNALRILGNGDVTPSRMIGSYAGAMGQPQFMPSSYLRYAVDYTGDGRRDIWTSRADVFASIANYLGKCGWVEGQPWGQPVTLTAPIDPGQAGRQSMRSLARWDAAGVRRSDGGRFSQPGVEGALLLPDGAGGDAFMIYGNFNVIRRYNPSDFYALAVGLIGNAAA
ncbi:lytic murein transglycosylase [Lichenicola sp.]|uniref:lytic murein transglycosylase n=1 Tax=Lichenicola sp. TaxID=2804529 RepID=UPI003AFFD15A